MNVITHGFTKEDQVSGVRIFVERDQTLTLRFRDDGSAFDLLEFRKMIEEWRGHHRTAHHRAPALA